MKFIFYRCMPAGMSQPTRQWHNTAQVHLSQLCAYKLLRRRSTLVRQVFDHTEVPDFRRCKLCTDKRSRNLQFQDWLRRWDEGGGRQGRDRYLAQVQKAWTEAFTTEHWPILCACDRTIPKFLEEMVA